ncbi:MAG TPA: autotransporter-associated beta strand repeat-containing protein [Candidatus Acidoferrales bacterium]|nr:autotransporter-associated beta strand repeat-containing protein [Candidatus Acidoferrales bacterium]
MKNHRLLIKIVTVVLFILSLAGLASATNFIWSGASGVNLFWKTSGNWFSGGPPTTNDFAIFFDAGATNVLGNTGIDSEVTNNITVNTLWLSQTNNLHNIAIDAGMTLTVAGTNFDGYGPLGSNPALSTPTNEISTVYVGTRDPATATTGVTNTISGAGTFLVINTNNEMNIRQVFAGSGNVLHQAVLDLSGLNTFTAKLGRIRIGDGENAPLSRAQGQLKLAATNTITLTGTNSADNVQLIIGNNDQNNNGNGGTSFLFLGQSNRLNIDRILVGAQKTPGQILLNPAFTSPTLVMRGSDGVSRMSFFRIGDESDAGASSNPTTGTVNLLGATSDILADTIIVGRGQNGSGNTTAATGTFSMGGGILNVNTLILGAQFNASQGGVITGTATFTNTTVTVNSQLALGVTTGASAARVANLNVFGGSMTVNGTYKNQGTVNINVTNATLTVPAGTFITARNLQLDGGTLANAAIIKATNALNIVNNGSITGTPVLDLGNSPNPAAWDVQGITNGSLTVNNALQGAGTINGNVIQAPGSTISPGGVSKAGTLTLNGNSGNLNLNNGGTLNFDLSTTSGGVNDQINISGTLTLNGTNNVFLKSLGGSLDTTTPYILITAGAVVGDQTQFKVVGPLTTGRYTFAFDTTSTPGQIKLVVGGTGPANQTWVGDGSANVWDAQGAFNWNNGASSQFFNLDNVAFGDTGSATPAVNVSGPLVTGSMTVSNAVKNYGLGGSGGLAVAGALFKAGPGSLTISNLSDNSFSSLTTVSNGAVTFANNGQNTFSGGITLLNGSLTLAGNSTNIIVDPNTGTPVITIGAGTTMSVLNSNANTFNGTQVQLDGTLAFGQPADATFDSVLIDAGSLTKSGPGKLTLSANNSSFTGPVLITGGTLVAGNTTSALGTGSSITITNTGALDVNGKNIGATPITVSGAGPTGAGALVNNGGPQNTTLTTTATALHNVTLTNDTTFGGSGQWNTDPIQNAGYFAITENLGTSGTNFNLTKTGPNELSLINTTVDPALGNINVLQGMLNFHGSTSSMGDPGSNITVSAGATVSFYDTSTAWDKKFILNGDGVTPSIWNYNGSHTIVGAITLNGSCVFGGAPAGRGAPVSLTLNGPVNGSGSLIKSAADTNALILAATNNYSGTTTVNGGTVLVEGISGTNSISVTGGLLGGIGFIRGAVTTSGGGNLSPGDANMVLATLIISNRLTLGGTCTMDADKTGSTFTSDVITNITTLTLGGTLALNLTGDTLVAGDSFKLFSFASASGAFTSITPSQPADGLQWDTSHLTTDGTLGVTAVNATPAPIMATVSGNQLTLSWPADHTGWRLQVQTNTLSSGLGSNWVDVAGSTLVNSIQFTLNPVNGTVFYRMVYP